MRLDRTTLSRFGICIAIAAALTTGYWLTSGDSSPLRDYYALNDSIAGGLFRALAFPPAVVGIFVSRNPHQPNEIAFYAAYLLQAFVLAYLAGAVIGRLTIGWSGRDP